MTKSCFPYLTCDAAASAAQRITSAIYLISSLICPPSCLAQSSAASRVVEIQAKCYQYSPKEIHLKKGVPVVLQITSIDKPHGFYVPDLNIDETIKPGKPALVKLTPLKSGTFPFSCDVFCGDGHDDMGGKLVVTDN